MTRDSTEREAHAPTAWAGCRVHTRVEWGLREKVGWYVTRKGEVSVRPSEENARASLADIARGEGMGWHDVEVVSRTVTTITTDWQPD